MSATPYPTINVSIAQNPADMIQFTNNVLSPWMAGHGFVFAVFLLTFLWAGEVDFKKRLLFSSGMSTISSVLLAAIGILPSNTIIVFLLLTGFLFALDYLTG